jgi:hypothetical protein
MGMCILEAVAYAAGEQHSDMPACVDSAIRRFLISINDRMPDDVRQELKPYIFSVIGTATTSKTVRLKRAWMLVDWSAKHAVPAALEVTGAHCWADALRELPAVVDQGTAWQTVFWMRFAGEVVREHWRADAAAAAYAYAATAAADAATAAATAAAYAAAYAATAAATAAAYAAAYAAGDAATAAVRAKARRGMWLDLLPSIKALLDALIAEGKS